MRAITLIFAMIYSICGVTSANFYGSGEYKTNTGDWGDYTVSANISWDDDTLLIDQTLEMLNFSFEVKVLLQKVDDNFFDVLDAASGEKVGSGYCWQVSDNGDEVCHSASHYDDHVVETTVKVTEKGLYRMGSLTNVESQEKLIWKDMLMPNE